MLFCFRRYFLFKTTMWKERNYNNGRSSIEFASSFVHKKGYKTMKLDL